MSREYTKQECIDMLMEHFVGLVSYWDGVEGSSKYKLNGLLHSILCTFDGVSGFMPAFDIVPCPHPDDKADNIEQDSNYWPDNLHINESTYLHEIMSDYKK